jgi:preprotein translocase subunit SecD
LVNWWYGGKKKLQSLSIGTVWKPEGADKTAAFDADSDGDADASAPALSKA